MVLVMILGVNVMREMVVVSMLSFVLCMLSFVVRTVSFVVRIVFCV